MNCRIKTKGNNRVVHTYAGLNNFIVKVYSDLDVRVKKIDSVIVDTWLQAIEKHTEFCIDYLLPTPAPAKEEIK